ncbi:MAG: replication protein [Oscillospiraceae bacterium]|nr:replication protein [Oscillospiraceae bacterium]
MADVQLEKGYTRIANDLLEALARAPLNGTQFRIVMLILRETYGFQRKECSCSETYAASRLGLRRQNVHRELKFLLNHNILSVVQAATFTRPRIISINKHYDTWLVQLHESETHTGIEKDASPVIENDSSTGIKSDSHRKKPLNKPLKKTPIAPKGATRSTYDSRFNEFWQAYPKKVGKGAAERSFKKYKPDDSLLSVMLGALECQRRSIQWQREGGQYIPNPSTWLNQRRWEDELEENSNEGSLPYLD